MSQTINQTIKYYQNGKERIIEHYLNDEYHNDGDEPAIIEFFENGNKKRERWYKNGKLHRNNDLPAQITYFKQDSLVDESSLKIFGKIWAFNGINCRETDEASNIEYFDNGNKSLELWFQNGKLTLGKFYKDKNNPNFFEKFQK